MDFDAIRQRFSLRDQLIIYGAKIGRDGRYRCVIPGHRDRDPSASYTVKNGVEHWRCHACDKGGDVIDLVSEVEGMSIAEAARHLSGDAPSVAREARPRPKPDREDVGLVFDLIAVPDEIPALRAGAESPLILSKRGKAATVIPADVYGYHLPDGTRVGYVLRIETPDGGKKHLPVRWDRTRGWVWAGWSGDDRPPLYNAPGLVRRQDNPVLLVEGEKCAKLAKALMPDYVVTCWLGGTAGVKRADFSLLAGREVTFWPDNDDGGRDAMKTAVAKAFAARSWWVEPSADWEKGADIADLIKSEGIDGARSFMEGREELKQKRTREPGELPPPGDWTRRSRGGWVPDGAYIDLTKDATLAVRSEINAHTGILHHPFFAGLAWDVVRRQIKLGPQDIVSGDDLRFLQTELARHTQVRLGIDTFGKLLSDAAMANPVNPLADRLRELRWDGVRRPLAGYAGVKQTPWGIAAFERWFLGLIRRILEPGCQHDLVLVLEGKQGLGKTSFLRTLGRPFGFDGFTSMEHLSSAGNDMMRLDGKLVIELAEMVAYRKSDREAFKSALTSTVDRYRRPYATTVVDVPRTCVFAGTTNVLDSYLNDLTGNRRIVPVRVSQQVRIRDLEHDLEQIYAEGVARFDNLIEAGAEVNWFSAEELAMQEEQTERREQASVFASLLDDYLAVISDDVLPANQPWEVCKLELMRDRKAFQEQMAVEMRRRGWSFRKGGREDRTWRWRRLPQTL